jgi:copper transport protein
VLTNWLHVTFVAIWLGGVAYLAAVLVPVALRQRDLIRPLGAAIAAFSSLAILCVLVVALSGIVQSASFVGSVEALFVTAYGRALLIKIGGFAVLIAFGAYHQFVIGSQLNAWRTRAETKEARTYRFRASIAIEAVVGALTLIAAAWMAVLPLARSPGP